MTDAAFRDFDPEATTFRAAGSPWSAIREAYLAGEGAPVLAGRHGVSVSAIRTRARDEGWRRRDAPSVAERDSAWAWEMGPLPATTLAELAWRRLSGAVARGLMQEARGWMRLHRELREEAATYARDVRHEDHLRETGRPPAAPGPARYAGPRPDIPDRTAPPTPPCDPPDAEDEAPAPLITPGPDAAAPDAASSAADLHGLHGVFGARQLEDETALSEPQSAPEPKPELEAEPELPPPPEARADADPGAPSTVGDALRRDRHAEPLDPRDRPALHRAAPAFDAAQTAMAAARRRE